MDASVSSGDAALTGKNRFSAVVESVDREASFAWLRVGKARLAARLWPGIRPRSRVVVRVRAEDVVLCTDVPGKVSTRNVLPGRVQATRRRPEGVLVTLDVGLALEALVTRRTITELGIRRGRKLVALVKATAIVPVADVHAPIRVSVVGRHDVIEPRRLDFLSALHATGSITAAARESGITYRAAWLWVEAMNKAWGAPLVRTTHGGTGGGGAAVTAEGHAVLELASRWEQAAREASDAG